MANQTVSILAGLATGAWVSLVFCVCNVLGRWIRLLERAARPAVAESDIRAIIGNWRSAAKVCREGEARELADSPSLSTKYAAQAEIFERNASKLESAING